METNELRQIRKTLGLSQGEMAVKAGVSFGTISALERGLLNKPQPRIAFKLAEAYGVTPDDIAPASQPTKVAG